jgi:hypothetical protein
MMEHSWTNSNPLNTVRTLLAGCGTQTAALGFGGYNPPTTAKTAVEEYDGNTWANLIV